MPPRIFVSYSRVDRPFVNDIIPLLRRVYGDTNVWFDDNLEGGQIWWDEILDQIAKCDIFMYLLSDKSVSSPYCLAELAEAQRLRKSILTVQVRAQTAVPENIAEIQYIDLSMGVSDIAAMTKLYAAIRLC